MMELVHEQLGGIQLIKVHAAEPPQFDRFSRHTEEIMSRRRRRMPRCR